LKIRPTSIVTRIAALVVMLDQVAGRSRATHPILVSAGTLFGERQDSPADLLRARSALAGQTASATSLILIGQTGQSNKVVRIVT
jgi:hypothetical protein